MDFWNDNTTYVTQRKWKMWIQKNVKVISNFSLKKKLNEKFNSEVHWIFLNIYIFDLFFKKWCDCYKIYP
jgi:hypothetical protein